MSQYHLNSTKQLIDLNGTTTNFEVQFNVVTENHEPFYGRVIDQTTLDNSEDIDDYQYAKEGELEGTIVQDNGEYQNYYLVLKADSPCNALVRISKKEIPKRERYVPPPPPPAQTSWTPYILVIGAIVIGGIALYYYYFRKGGDNSSNSQPEAYNSSPVYNPTPIRVIRRRPDTPKLPSPTPPPTGAPVENRVENRGEQQQQSVLNRLRNLNLD